jgi:hypothetical protein
LTRFKNMSPKAFSAPRFKALYLMWKTVLAELGSAALTDAVTAAAGRVEALELGHRYGDLSPWSRRLRSSSHAERADEVHYANAAPAGDPLTDWPASSSSGQGFVVARDAPIPR